MIAGIKDTTTDTGDGGPATAATVSGIAALAADSVGNLYLATGCVVRRITISTGIIDRFAGTGTNTSNCATTGDSGPATDAELDTIVDLAIDADDNLHIGHVGRIRTVDATTNIITTTAGDGSWSTSTGDGGPATGATFQLDALAIDASDNIVFVDNARHRLRRITTDRIVNAFAGDGTTGTTDGPVASARFTGISDLHFLPDGTLLIVDDDRLRAIDTTRTTVTTISSSWTSMVPIRVGPLSNTEFGSSARLASDAAGYIVIATRDALRLIDPARTTVVDVTWPLARYGNGLLVGTSAGTIRYVDLNSGIITRFAGTGEPGHAGDGGPRLSARIGAPSGIAATNDGRVYFSDNLSGGATDGRVRCIGCDGSDVVSTVVDGTMAPTTAGLGRVAIDPNGAVAFSMGTAVLRWDPATDDVETIAGSPSTPGNSGDEGPATSARLTAAIALRYGINGDLFIADAATRRVRRIDHATGIIHAYAGTGTQGNSGDGGPATAAQLAVPWAIDVGTHTYVVDLLSGVVRRIEGSVPILQATATDASLAVGASASITVTANNDSETAVTGPVVATATAPTGLEFVSADSPDGWDCTVDATELTCTHDDNLAPSASRAFAVDVTATGAATGAIELDTALISDDGAAATATATLTVTAPTTSTTTLPTPTTSTAPTPTLGVTPVAAPKDPPAAQRTSGTLPRTGSTRATRTFAFAFVLLVSSLALIATSRPFWRAKRVTRDALRAPKRK